MEALKKRDRTLLEMHLGQLFFGLMCQIVGAFFVSDQARYAAGIWFGTAAAMVAALHMARTLDRALSQGDAAAKIITRGYMIRYVMIVIFLVIVSLTNMMNPLVVFLGYMSLKVTAYLQPFTHKALNRLLHETDPIPQPLQEENVSQEGHASSGESSQP